MTTEKPKAWNEEFATFFENPSRETLRDLLRHNVGEFNELDFKLEWPGKSSLGRHILAVANSKGGCIVLGVEDGTMDPKGLAEPRDKADVFRDLAKYVPAPLVEELSVATFAYAASDYPKLKGKTFQVLFISDYAGRIPFIAISDGRNIRKAAVYVRKGTESIEADYDGLQRLINRRLETGLSSSAELDLREHLAQLRILYQQLSHTRETGTDFRVDFMSAVRSVIGFERVSNPDYPTEGLDEFVAKAIKLKKQTILETLHIALPSQ